MKKKTILIVSAVPALILAAGCAPTIVDNAGTQGVGGDVAGFWKGLWHGLTILIMFVVSLFKDNVGIYQTANSGNMYNLGYLLGVMIFFGCSGSGACRKGK
jgi:hypothetical protein